MSNRHTNIPAAYLILIDNGKILLLRRYNTGFEDGKYSLIAGHVEPGESFTQCIIREAREEAGIELDSEDLRVVHLMHRKPGEATDNERVDVFFIASKWTGEVTNREPEKCDDLSWFGYSQMPDNTIPYIRQVVASVSENCFYSERGWTETQ